MLIKDHPAAKQDVKDRASQLLRDVEGYLSADQIQMIRKGKPNEALRSIVDALVLS